MIKLKNEFEFYKKNKESLKKDYLGKFIIIQGDKILASYNSREQALKEAINTLKLEIGTFLIQHVVSDDSEDVQRFYSRIA